VVVIVHHLLIYMITYLLLEVKPFPLNWGLVERKNGSLTVVDIP